MGTIRENAALLQRGATKIDGIDVRITQRKGRYIAYLTGPKFNTVVEVPRQISPEGANSFYERVAQKISAIKEMA
jgi:hypothetical protein